MMGIVMPETCWAYKKYDKILSGIYSAFYSSVITMLHGPINIINSDNLYICILKFYIEVKRPVIKSLLLILIV